LADLSKTPAEISGMFDAIAGRYDLLNHLLSAGIDRRWRRSAIRSLALEGRERVLDLCTGTADLAIAARTAHPPAARVVGIDFAGAMLRAGHAKLQQQSLTGEISLVRGDATRIPVAAKAVDAITVAFGIRNVEDAGAACAEMYRVLAPGGRIAILEFGTPRSAGIRAAYLWYFKRILPRIGRLISRHAVAYDYLPSSVGSFLSPQSFAGLLTDAGFVDVAFKPLTFGIVYLYTGSRSGLDASRTTDSTRH
jgi:demethylmenaquinone methyltransferase/2-methoxy-6-polyprenyl-1,4-benzoquinol methylase